MSLCNNSSDNKSSWIHRVSICTNDHCHIYAPITAFVTFTPYKFGAAPRTLTWQSLDLVQCHLELWPGNHLIWCNATSNSDLETTWFGAMPPSTLTWQSLDLVQYHLQLWPGNHLIWCNATSNSDLAITWFVLTCLIAGWWIGLFPRRPWKACRGASCTGQWCWWSSRTLCPPDSGVKKGRKEEKNVMIYLTTRSTYFIYGYMASDIMVKDHSDSERSYHGATFRSLE